MLSWFENHVDFMRSVDTIDARRRSGEAHIATQEQVPGYCAVCDAMTTYVVRAGAFYDNSPNLREGLICRRCGLSNRNRLIYTALRARAAELPQADVAMLECLTPLFVALRRQLPQVLGSEYISDKHQSGQVYSYHGHPVRHESITQLSYADASLDLIGHCDVLEHVYDYRAALREVRRVLRPQGQMICTVPFFMTRHEEAVLARPRDDGSIEFFGKPEYHGDGLRPEGILTWHHFGWKLLADARAAGFAGAQIGLDYDLFCGFATNNHPSREYGLMYPLLFRAIA
ncbi:class I SAM-dependent methyltransferase [Tahibacter sp.]|uniref:class I SAM-dependent methyltransferase n=1 Tax=Tahibacter sp. TaxID=2056211 RepID=UPI002D80958F|nr:class I SAM-dependent methyltransferase [Tahibacter sp.]